MLWRTVVVETPCRLFLHGDRFVLEEPLGSWKADTVPEGSRAPTVIRENIPVSDLASVIIDHRQVTITVPLLTRLTEVGASVVFCGQKHLPAGMVTSFSSSSKAYLYLSNQIRFCFNEKHERARASLWAKLIKQKIENQHGLLQACRASCILKKLPNQVKPGDSTNREGFASLLYFPEMFGKGFNRNQDNRVNSILNYGYTILRSQVARQIVASGLHQNISIFHKNQFNSFSLADDLMEVYRPLVDFLTLVMIDPIPGKDPEASLQKSSDQQSVPEDESRLGKADRRQIMSFLYETRFPFEPSRFLKESAELFVTSFRDSLCKNDPEINWPRMSESFFRQLITIHQTGQQPSQ